MYDDLHNLLNFLITDLTPSAPPQNKYKQTGSLPNQTVAPAASAATTHNKMKERTVTSTVAIQQGPSAQTSDISEHQASVATELVTEATTTSTNQADPSRNTNVSEPISSAKSDRNKNLINIDSQLPLNNNQTHNNTGSSCSQSSSSPLHSQQPKAEPNKDSNSESPKAADVDKDSIGNINSFSSNCLPAKGSSADETDRATESNLDSDLNIKNNNNIIQNKTAATTITIPSTAITATAPAAATAATALLSEPNTDTAPATNENTKDVCQITPANVTDINNGLTNSINTINNNKNSSIDKDSDNNDVIRGAEAAATAAAQVNDAAVDDVQQPANAAIEDAAKSSSESDQQPGGAGKSGASKSQTLLNYEEGQWSPDNVDGRKIYKREQLVQLQHAAASTTPPQITDQFQLFARKNFCMPSFATGKNTSTSNSRNAPLRRPSNQGQQMQQGGGGKGSKHGMIHVSLSLREDVKLNESANAWKPTFMASSPDSDENNIEMLCKKVRGILNKLTPEKFEPLLEQIQALNIGTQEKLTSVISLVFEKAIDEPNFAEAYAMLCKNLTKPIEEAEKKEREDGKNMGDKPSEQKAQLTFKKELVNKCQKEFDNHVADENAMQTKLTPFKNDLNNCTDPNRKMELRAQLDEEERKLRRRSVGTVRFIGELYRQGMLTTNIMDYCITTLLNIRTEEKLECLCKLLTTVGHKMEEKTGQASVDKKNYRDLNPHFQTMQSIADNKKQNKISSRVRFMLLDVIELRKRTWVSRRNDYNPKTMGQIQKEAEQEQYNKHILTYDMGSGSMSGPTSGSGMGGGGGNRKDNRGNDRNDRNERGSMRNDSRSGSSGGNYSNNKSNNNSSRGGGYQDNDGWTQAGNKNRGSNSSTSIDPSKFRGKAVSRM